MPEKHRDPQGGPERSWPCRHDAHEQCSGAACTCPCHRDSPAVLAADGDPLASFRRSLRQAVPLLETELRAKQAAYLASSKTTNALREDVNALEEELRAVRLVVGRAPATEDNNEIIPF